MTAQGRVRSYFVGVVPGFRVVLPSDQNSPAHD